MSLRKLPAIQARQGIDALDGGVMPAALERWNAALRPVSAAGDNVINIYDAIGEDPWSDAAVTAKTIAAALERTGAQPVIVNINSPGGDLFEGIAIYNLVRLHQQQVTVRIVGLAASAASIVAMAGDRIEIAQAGFIMIHNAWVMAMGDRHDMREIADMLEPFDAAIAGVYAARTGLEAGALGRMMDDETWLSGEAAVEKKFADGLLTSDQTIEDAAARAALAPIVAVRRIEAALARQGLPRAQRRELIKELKAGTPRAAAHAMPEAGAPSLEAGLLRAILTLKP